MFAGACQHMLGLRRLERGRCLCHTDSSCVLQNALDQKLDVQPASRTLPRRWQIKAGSDKIFRAAEEAFQQRRAATWSAAHSMSMSAAELPVHGCGALVWQQKVLKPAKLQVWQRININMLHIGCVRLPRVTRSLYLASSRGSQYLPILISNLRHR